MLIASSSPASVPPGDRSHAACAASRLGSSVSIRSSHDRMSAVKRFAWAVFANAAKNPRCRSRMPLPAPDSSRRWRANSRTVFRPPLPAEIPTREFARQRLEKSGAGNGISERHLGFLAAFGGGPGEYSRSEHAVVAANRIDTELPNLLAARVSVRWVPRQGAPPQTGAREGHANLMAPARPVRHGPARLQQSSCARWHRQSGESSRAGRSMRSGSTNTFAGCLAIFQPNRRCRVHASTATTNGSSTTSTIKQRAYAWLGKLATRASSDAAKYLQWRARRAAAPRLRTRGEGKFLLCAR